jgi:hypothetical protein
MGHHLMGSKVVSLYYTMRLALLATRPPKIRAILFATACGFAYLDQIHYNIIN